MKYGACNGVRIQMPLSFKRWQTKVTIVLLVEHDRGYMYVVLVVN